jgi:hypothetical protein
MALPHWFLTLPIDVVKAFTHAEMTEEVYVEQPHGFEEPGMTCLLNQALEGTKQAAHLWQKELVTFLGGIGFERSPTDPCLFTQITETTVMRIIVWVDDLCVASSTQEMFEAFYAKFSKKFNSKKLGMKIFVGIEIERDRAHREIVLRQTLYIEKLFARHLTESNTKAWKTPSGTSRDDATKFIAIGPATTDAEKTAMLGKDFLGVMGGLLYAAVMTRPDISYHCSHLCRAMHSPSPAGFQAALGVIAYLYQSKSRGIKYGGARKYASAEVTENTLVGFSDSSFGPPYPHCGGFIEFNGANIDWFSRVHKFAPQSTWEAELAAINMLLKIMRFATHLYFDMTKKKLPTPWLFTDSKSAFDTIKNPGATKRSNHLERWLHFARELYLRNAIRYGLVPTHLMMADNMTKVTDRDKFFTCIQYQMGM